MKNNKLKIEIALIGVAFILFFGYHVLACGPFFPNYIMTPEDIDGYYPLQDKESFINSSNYQIVLSKWGPEYLFYIYRDLSGDKLSPEVRKSLLTYYENRGFGTSNDWLSSDSGSSAVGEWKIARKLVVNQDVDIYTTQQKDFANYTNCYDDAFRIATETLKSRLKIYSKEQMKTWLAGQDAVFANCGQPAAYGVKKLPLAASIGNAVFSAFFQRIWQGTKHFFVGIGHFFKNLFVKKDVVPSSPEITSFPPEQLLKYDQEYQQAAADFYRNDFTTAEKEFQVIANEEQSPWRAYAALALSRTYIRMLRLGNLSRTDAEKTALLQKAQAQLNSILENQSLAQAHNGARLLLGYVDYRLDPKKRLQDAGKILLVSNNPEEVLNNLDDLSNILFKFNEYRSATTSEGGGDFLQWAYAWRDQSPEALELSLQKYQQTKSLPWLLASLENMTTGNPLKGQIIADSLKIPENSPIYLTANYYRLKLAISDNNLEQARKDIDKILNSSAVSGQPIFENYFRDLRMMVSEDLNTALANSPRKVLAVDYGYDGRAPGPVKEHESALLLDNKAKQFFNEFLPNEKWVEIVSSEKVFGAPITKQIRLAAFVRAVLLDDFASAKKIADLLAASDSELKKDLSDFLRAEQYSDKKFAAVLFILQYPRLDCRLNASSDEILINESSLKEVDNFRRNWWDSRSYTYQKKYNNVDIFKKFISIQGIEQAKTENLKLQGLVAPNYLADIVINYALNNLSDERVANALYLAVQATRFAGERDEKTTEFSQKAFQILHDNFPASYWTQQTPYWY